VALLLILIRPVLTPSPYLIPETIPLPADGMMKTSPAMTDDLYNSETSLDSANQATTQSTPDYFTALITADSVVVTYLTTAQPSYLVVTDAANIVVAVSELLSPGELADYTFKARAPFISGALYTATLHFDNGDGVYELANDVVAIDISGIPLSIPVTLP
jgi:hypothetical protein